MHITVNQTMFRDALDKAGRKDAFSYQAQTALFEYLEQNEPDMELDPIAFCRDWEEYDSKAEAADDFDLSESELPDCTIIIECDNGHFLVACA